MNDILYVIRVSHKRTELEMARLIKVPLTFYKKLEAGEIELTFEQSKVYGVEFNIDPSFFILKKNSVINHNMGNSYTLVINPTNFYANPTKEQLEVSNE